MWTCPGQLVTIFLADLQIVIRGNQYKDECDKSADDRGRLKVCHDKSEDARATHDHHDGNDGPDDADLS